MKIFAVPAGLLALTVAFESVMAGPFQVVLDQEYAPSSFNNGIIIGLGQTVAQTFTVGIEGILDRVEVEIARDPFDVPADGVTLQIRPTEADGLPATTVLASVFIPALDIAPGPPVGPDVPPFHSVDLRSFGIGVTEGEGLAIVLSSNARGIHGGIDPYEWVANGPGGYSRGTGAIDILDGGFFPAFDFPFRTFVLADVPEPAGIALVMTAALVLLGHRWSIRQRNRVDLWKERCT